jgi:hypothetical protein
MGNQTTKITPTVEKTIIDKNTHISKHISLHNIDNVDYIKYCDGVNNYTEQLIGTYIKNNEYDETEYLEFSFENSSKLIIKIFNSQLYYSFKSNQFSVEEPINDYDHIGNNSQFDLILKLFYHDKY